MKLPKKTAIALSVCTALAATAGAAVKDESVEVSPFEMQKLAGGYMVTDSHEGKESEGACGEGSCGATDDKGETEGSCGEGSCGAADDKGETEGSCGEGSCGAADDKDEAEGACGEGSCGGQV